MDRFRSASGACRIVPESRAVGAPCGDLAMALAEAVIDAAGVGLAVEVLAGGEHQIARATEFAARVLDATQCEASSLGETSG